MKHLLNLFFLTFFYLNASAQTIKITGYVIDDDTEEPLPFCSVYQLGTSNGTATDIDGNYVFEIDLSQAPQGKNVDIAIITLLGKVVYQTKIESLYTTRHQIMLDNLESGQYFIRIQAQGKKMVMKKLVVFK